MKPLLILLSAMFVAAIGWWLGSPEQTSSAPTAAQLASPAPLPTSIINDPVTVFQNAFWKRPTPEDQILHAERREWRAGAEISQWQWFISVRPSRPLVAHLITDNAFGLTPSPEAGRKHAENLPSWFPKEAGMGGRVLTGHSGALTLIWDEASNLLHATGSGGGFHRGLPSQPQQPVVSAQPQPTSRLPTTPPPKP
ncbi:MAG: hypothetical protein ACO1TE_03930 [Prosthecobacter sp.]